MERGVADGAPIADWIAAGIVLGLVPRIEYARNPADETRDAGHLQGQELLLRLAAPAGYTGRFELRTGSGPSGGSIDVCLRDPIGRRLVVAEYWNVIEDVGAGKRSFDRKLAEAADVAGWLDGGDQAVGGVWVVRATRRNRLLVARFPAVFATAFPGSSRLWLAALTAGGPLPPEPGLVWSDVAATRLFEWRR